ncbi:hypothetical protein EIQ03_11980 [Xanthomonas campestris pv. raphani]|nr:hypothetical protein D0A40_18710 [Xanthomonas campestris pv. raphani]
MMDARGRHQDGEQAQDQGVVRTRRHARKWPDYRLASVAWNPACPRPGERADTTCGTTGLGHGRGYPQQTRQRVPLRGRQRARVEGLSCADDTRT